MPTLKCFANKYPSLELVFFKVFSKTFSVACCVLHATTAGANSSYPSARLRALGTTAGHHVKGRRSSAAARGGAAAASSCSLDVVVAMASPRPPRGSGADDDDRG
jgi:hypothetical protein